MDLRVPYLGDAVAPSERGARELVASDPPSREPVSIPSVAWHARERRQQPRVGAAGIPPAKRTTANSRPTGPELALTPARRPGSLELDDVVLRSDSRDQHPLACGRFDEALDSGALDLTLDPPSRPRRHPAEIVLVLLANTIWAIAGFVLWIPVLARTLVISVLELAHDALTHQRSSTTTQRIRRASRFYSGAFLHRRKFDSVSSGARRNLQLARLAAETLWAAAFYGVLLWAGGLISFSPTHTLGAIGELFASWGNKTVRLGADLWSRAPEDLAVMRNLGTGSWVILGLLLVVAHVTGWWLARRR